MNLKLFMVDKPRPSPSQGMRLSTVNNQDWINQTKPKPRDEVIYGEQPGLNQLTDLLYTTHGEQNNFESLFTIRTHALQCSVLCSKRTTSENNEKSPIICRLMSFKDGWYKGFIRGACSTLFCQGSPMSVKRVTKERPLKRWIVNNQLIKVHSICQLSK